jgi:hypothetical protein
MDRITQSFLDDFVREHELEGVEQDKQFEHFASFITTRRHYNGDTFDTADIVTGSGGDTGVDAIAILVNGSLVTDVESLEEHADLSGNFDVMFVFVQAERSSFGFGVRDFFEPRPKLVRNAMVESRAEIMDALYRLGTKFRPGNPALRLFYVATGNWVGDTNLEARRQAVVDDLRSMQIFRDVEFTCLGADGTQRLYRETKNTISREFTFASRTLVPEIAGVNEAYLGFIPLSEFLSIVKDENGELVQSIFYDNVRDWQDYNAVNGEIRATLTSQIAICLDEQRHYNYCQNIASFAAGPIPN